MKKSPIWPLLLAVTATVIGIIATPHVRALLGDLGLHV